MTKKDVYDIWRPAASVWSPWVKPVLFSFIGQEELESSTIALREWPVPMDRNTAIIVNLPDEESVEVGVGLVRSRYQPVPLYNACPSPAGGIHYTPRSLQSPITLNLDPIVRALCASAQELRDTNLPADAMPAFLLDENRHGWDPWPDPGSFDNRSFVSHSDFPSAGVLIDTGISRVVLIQRGADIQFDLREILLRWQREGIVIARQELWGTWEPRKLRVKRPSFLSFLWNKIVIGPQYHQDRLGRFGEVVRHSNG